MTYYFTVRQSTGDEWYSLRRSAADNLYPPLRRLRAIIRKHGRVEVTKGEAAFACKTLYDSIDRQELRLPERWRHLSRSLRAATGTALGAVSFLLTSIRALRTANWLDLMRNGKTSHTTTSTASSVA